LSQSAIRRFRLLPVAAAIAAHLRRLPNRPRPFQNAAKVDGRACLCDRHETAMNDAVAFAELINLNRHRLVPEGSPLPTIVNVALGKRQFSREDMYHQAVSVTCEIAGQISRLDLWVKHRPGIHESFATLDSVYKRIGDGVFPK